MCLSVVQSSDTLFQSQQGFVYLCPIDPCLLAHIYGVSPPLTTSQVYEGHLTGKFLPVV